MAKRVSFKDFFFSEENPDRIALPGRSSFEICAASVGAALLASSSASLSKEKSEEFAMEVSKAAQSESFIEDISTEIGEPRADESEDAFVRRAKSVMKEALRHRFRRT